jgi:hypothetical protein
MGTTMRTIKIGTDLKAHPARQTSRTMLKSMKTRTMMRTRMMSMLKVPTRTRAPVRASSMARPRRAR